MIGGGAGVFRDEEWPDLWEWPLWGRVKMHRVPRLCDGRYEVGRPILGVGHCGRMCWPPFSRRGHEVAWCDTCFPEGPPNAQETIDPDEFDH